MKSKVLQFVEYRPDCPDCGARGAVINVQGNSEVKVECPKCHAKWMAAAGVCPVCGGFNGFAAGGLCLKCYRKKLKSIKEKAKVNLRIKNRKIRKVVDF